MKSVAKESKQALYPCLRYHPASRNVAIYYNFDTAYYVHIRNGESYELGDKLNKEQMRNVSEPYQGTVTLSNN